MWQHSLIYLSFLLLDEIKVDTEDDPQHARIIAFSVWGILRGLESFSQLIYTKSQYPGLVSTKQGKVVIFLKIWSLFDPCLE